MITGPGVTQRARKLASFIRVVILPNVCLTSRAPHTVRTPENTDADVRDTTGQDRRQPKVALVPAWSGLRSVVDFLAFLPTLQTSIHGNRLGQLGQHVTLQIYPHPVACSR